MKEEFVSRQQVNLLSERILKAEQTDATKILNIYLWNLYEMNDYKPMKILVVGAGGSYPAALLAAHVIRDEMRTSNVEAVTPQTAVRILSQFKNIVNCTWRPEYDLVIGISYSGKTPDIKFVADLCKDENYPFVLLTGANVSEISELYKENDDIKIISYFNSEDTTGKERGMISMASTLAPAIIFDDNWTAKCIDANQKALANAEKFVSKLDIPGIAKSIKQHPIIHVFYEWDTYPTAADIESKFIESGVANVVLHEKKNFSHGRYTSLYNQDFSVIINLNRYNMTVSLDGNYDVGKVYRNNYDEILAAFLSKICTEKQAHYIDIGTVAMMPSQWNIEAMAKIPYLITVIGEELDIDISKPLIPFPKEAIDLYNYKGLL